MGKRRHQRKHKSRRRFKSANGILSKTFVVELVPVAAGSVTQATMKINDIFNDCLETRSITIQAISVTAHAPIPLGTCMMQWGVYSSQDNTLERNPLTCWYMLDNARHQTVYQGRQPIKNILEYGGRKPIINLNADTLIWKHQVIVNNNTISDTFYGTTFGNSIVLKVYYTYTTPV